MKYHAATMLAAAAAALTTTVSASATVVCSESEVGSYNNSEVCHVENNTPQPATDLTLPCVEVIFRDNTCHFEADEPNYPKAHENCHCHGTTFSAWIECQKCLVDHGFHNEDDVYWSKILNVASEALCTGSPTAAAASSLSTPAEAGTVIPTPISSDISPTETFKDANQTTITAQGPWVNQTATTTAGAIGPQKTCIDDFEMQETNTAVPIESFTPTEIITIPLLPTSSFTSVSSLDPTVTTSNWLPGEGPGSSSFSDHESSGAASSSSFGKSGLAVAIAGAIVMGVM
ncbi:hypothetical protein ACQKWADRAFT_330391 [Trichoderma austrokoningii]